jgi:hypothetical protein
MRIIKYNNKDFPIFETPEEAKKYDIAFVEYWEASEGDYVVDYNGVVVPLIRRVEVTNTKRRIGKKYYTRPQAHVYDVYTFPGCKFMVRRKNDITAERKRFVYSRSYGTIRDIYEQTGKQLTPRKMYFALLLANGIEPEIAIGIVHKVSDRRKLRHLIFKYMTCPQTIYYFTYVAMKMGTLKDELEKRGITSESMAQRVVSLMDDEEAPAVIRKWALDVGLQAINDQQSKQGQPIYLPETVNIVALRERLQLKQAEIEQ